MKERVTYILPKNSGLTRDEIRVSKDALEFTRAARAAREWHLTIHLAELPDELQIALSDHYELHVRWVSPTDTSRVPPFVARLPSGLHAFFRPRSTSIDVPVCSLLKKLVGDTEIECDSIVDMFNQPQLLSRDVGLYQYFTPTVPKHRIGEVLLERICESAAIRNDILDACQDNVRSMDGASYVDLDLDADAKTVTLSAYWSANAIDSLASSPKQPLRKARDHDRLEVGVLQAEEPDRPGQMKVGGFLTVIGDDEKPGGTLFSFPSRHHPLPSDDQTVFEVSFEQPTGLHPKLELIMPRKHITPPKDSCALHAYLTLSSDLFIDRYQLSDTLTLASHNLVQMHMLSGEDDLEAPEWTTKGWGSASLFELAHPTSNVRGSKGVDRNWTVTIPLHLRYLNGSVLGVDDRSQVSLKVPWPVVFWACEADAGFKMSTNPFDRTDLGYDRLFGPRTLFYHIPPAQSAETVGHIAVPVLDVARANQVPLGTLAVVLLGFLWVCWKLLTVRNPTTGSSKDKKT